MNIDFDALARLIELTQTAKIHALEIQDGNQIIKIQKYADTSPMPQNGLPQNYLSQNYLSQNHLPQTHLTKNQAPQNHTPPTPTQISHEPQNPQVGHSILSPMLGTFYRKASPDTPNFVEIGDFVKSGDTLCIIEAMKIMHEVKADKAGVIDKILANDGDMVEYDAPLFVIGSL
ncbi:acetyl-CoA carboxylase biotin carboxyl carrier protein [Moraxella nasovis]|uniref:acetyl-CoA carboxylase biotin carboxyl carrier protein n=1 Tax=Moraxella nasovis TaxID=2904121 RepID=UPI001F6064BB|nr:acetyl-CoA carboxylase biotin carboxyl carrier protein [Moraxella nasovis]UNU73654.1 acetyl-CoA carboxylase biotin carboxyl carrier protein [Moraxella nasovis]